MQNRNKRTRTGKLSKQEKESWDRTLENLLHFLNTAEGQYTYERTLDVFTRPLRRALKTLPERELKALRFIKREERIRGKQPTVRAVAKELGYTSSRTGAQIVKILEEKGVLHWSWGLVEQVIWRFPDCC